MREYENDVYFVHRLGRRGSGPLLARRSQGDVPGPQDKRQRMRHYSQRVKAHFQPMLDRRQSLDLLLRKEIFSGLKPVRDLHRVKLFNLV